MIQKYYNPLNEEKTKQGYERTKRNDKQKEYRNRKNTETIIKKKQKSIMNHKGYRDLEKSKKWNLNKARKNIMKGTNLTYLLKQNSN